MSCHYDPMDLRTDRLLIRPWRVQEAPRLFDMRRRIEVARWIGGTPMSDPHEASTLIERYDEQLAADPRFGAWAIVERSSHRPAGTVLLKSLPNGDGEIEIGWHVHPDCWGRGLATEAAAAVLARGFAYGLDEVWAVTDPANARSIRVAQKLGMSLLGLTHRWYPEPSLMFWVPAGAGQRPSIEPDETVATDAR